MADFGKQFPDSSKFKCSYRDALNIIAAESAAHELVLVSKLWNLDKGKSSPDNVKFKARAEMLRRMASLIGVLKQALPNLTHVASANAETIRPIITSMLKNNLPVGKPPSKLLLALPEETRKQFTILANNSFISADPADWAAEAAAAAKALASQQAQLEAAAAAAAEAAVTAEAASSSTSQGIPSSTEAGTGSGTSAGDVIAGGIGVAVGAIGGSGGDGGFTTAGAIIGGAVGGGAGAVAGAAIGAVIGYIYHMLTVEGEGDNPGSDEDDPH